MAYLFGAISREEAEGLVSEGGVEDGKFLARKRGKNHPDDFVLCVGYRGKPTHHLVTKKDGIMHVNNKNFGDFSKIEDLVSHLSSKQPGWPVPLNKPVKNPEYKAPGGGTKKRKASVSKKKDGTTKPKKPKWLHGELSQQEANDLVTQAGLDDGRFLVRSRAGKKGQYVLCVVYKGKPTHHLILKDEEDGLYRINKKSYGDFTKLKELITHLQGQGVKGWPVPLSLPVERDTKGEDDAKSVKSVKPVEPAEVKEESKPEPEVPEPATKEAEPEKPAETPATEPEPAEPKTVDPASPDVLGKAPVKEDAPVAEGELPMEMQRVLARAVIKMGNKIAAYENKINEMAAILSNLEMVALQAQSKNRRATFADLDASLFASPAPGQGGIQQFPAAEVAMVSPNVEPISSEAPENDEYRTRLSHIFGVADVTDGTNTFPTPHADNKLDKTEMNFRLDRRELATIVTQLNVGHLFEMEEDGKVSVLSILQRLDKAHDHQVSREEFVAGIMRLAEAEKQKLSQR
eukprot:m.334494 g.334494  ORF g.334494 m.334494 type:complete len:517 (+) comp17366_c0_seq1:136-1686(+)